MQHVSNIKYSGTKNPSHWPVLIKRCHRSHKVVQ